MEAFIAFAGQVAGRIDAIEPVDEIITRTVNEFRETARRMAAYG